MTRYLGDLSEDQPLRFTFSTTNRADGEPITLAGSPSLKVYKDGSDTESTAGITLTVDFDGNTGCQHVEIITTDAFYTTGADYSIVIHQGTVDTISVAGMTIGTFSIENRHTAAGGGGDATQAKQDTIIADVAAVKTVVDGIKTVTDLLPDAGALTSLATAAATTAIQATVDGIKTVTDQLPNGGALTSLAQATALATVQTTVDGIKTVTDQLPDGGALSSLATAAALSTVDGNVTTILGHTGPLSTDWADGGRLDVILDAAAASAASADANAASADANAATAVANQATIVANQAVMDGKLDSLVSGVHIATIDAAAIGSIHNTVQPEVYADAGDPVSPMQALYAIHQYLFETELVGTESRTKRLDQSTAARTLNLDSATAPTSKSVAS